MRFYTPEIDPSPLATQCLAYFAEQELIDAKFDADDYEYQQMMALCGDSMLARAAYNREFDL